MKQLISDLSKTDLSSKDFRSVLQQAKDLLGKTDHELAELLHFSRPTITRWLDGDSCPHPQVRNAVQRGLLKAIQQPK